MASFTQSQLDILTSAIAEGALIVQYGDKRVEYRTLNEMVRIKAMMEADILKNSGTKKTTRYYNQVSKGTH